MKRDLLAAFRRFADGAGDQAWAAGPPSSESEVARRGRLVGELLSQTSQVLEHRRRRARGGEEEWGDEEDEELAQVEEALGDAATGLAAARGGAGKGLAGREHGEHREAGLRMLERRREGLGAELARQKGERAARRARRATVGRAKEVGAKRGRRRDNGNNDDDDDEELRREEEARRREVMALEEELAMPKVELSEAERKELLVENEDMRERMMDQMKEAAEDIQRQLSELSSIMTRFSVEMTSQHEEINSIIDAVTRASVNVDMGNAQLIEASSTSADFRFFVLLFLTIMTVSLLFLHWYSN